MSIEAFNQTFRSWNDSLRHYSLDELTAQPSADSWSMGQLYHHIINETSFYIGRIKVCISSNRHANKEMSVAAREMFRKNSFPDERLKGAPSNARIPQPASKRQLLKQFSDLKKKMNDTALLMEATVFNGKSKHPGLNYFTAAEWLQFADMHLRHHLKQKERLEIFLRSRR